MTGNTIRVDGGEDLMGADGESSARWRSRAISAYALSNGDPNRRGFFEGEGEGVWRRRWSMSVAVWRR